MHSSCIERDSWEAARVEYRPGVENLLRHKLETQGWQRWRTTLQILPEARVSGVGIFRAESRIDATDASQIAFPFRIG